MESVNLLQRGDYDGIKTAIDTAMKAGADRDLGHDYMIDVDDRFLETTRKTVPTGWDVVVWYDDGDYNGADGDDDDGDSDGGDEDHNHGVPMAMMIRMMMMKRVRMMIIPNWHSIVML